MLRLKFFENNFFAEVCTEEPVLLGPLSTTEKTFANNFFVEVCTEEPVFWKDSHQ